MLAVVVSHINEGPRTGVMRLDLTYGAIQLKLLMNRKDLNGKIQYQMNMIQERGPIHYRLATTNKDKVVLERTQLSKIVTD
jgi:hypothetical protein